MFRRSQRLAVFAALFLAACASGAGSGTHEPQNLAIAKSAALAYHDSGQYLSDIAAVDAEAEAYVASRAGAVPKPALVLDIDETSLSNWDEIKADDFGYIANGGCDRLPQGPCGIAAWDQLEKAPAIAPTLQLFNAAKSAGVAVFFVTGRHEAERAITEETLRKAGYAGWQALMMRGNDGAPSVATFKSGERAKIAAEGYTILATVGDQMSDLDGGYAERGFKLPNPFYFIP